MARLATESGRLNENGGKTRQLRCEELFEKPRDKLVVGVPVLETTEIRNHTGRKEMKLDGICYPPKFSGAEAQNQTEDTRIHSVFEDGAKSSSRSILR